MPKPSSKRSKRRKPTNGGEMRPIATKIRDRTILSIVPCADDWRVLWAAPEGIEERRVACWALVRARGEPASASPSVAPVVWAAHCLDLGDESELFVTLVAPGESSAAYAEQGRALYAEVGRPIERLTELPPALHDELEH
jgi:hypothetical protein